jgi:hypothetical protein
MTYHAYSPTILLAGNGDFHCARCEHRLALAAQPWKEHVARHDQPLAELGEVFDTGSGGVFIRRYFCPACASALDSETALENDTLTHDTVRISPPGVHRA